jgi:hypothetical protein
MIDQSTLLSAANSYSNEHGHDALTALLRAQVNVSKITDVTAEDREVVYFALMNGRMIAARKEQRREPAKIDYEAIWARYNRAGRKDEFDFG